MIPKNLNDWASHLPVTHVDDYYRNIRIYAEQNILFPFFKKERNGINLHEISHIVVSSDEDVFKSDFGSSFDEMKFDDVILELKVSYIEFLVSNYIGGCNVKANLISFLKLYSSFGLPALKYECDYYGVIYKNIFTNLQTYTTNINEIWFEFLRKAELVKEHIKNN